jgi:RNA polymerase sigma-70 factor (ECF subfamily)
MVDHVETEVVRHEAVGEMVAAIGRLGDADREVIRLAGWEELERDELGVALGCTSNAATKKLNRALDRLAGELGVSQRAGGRFFTRGVSQ